VIRRDSVKRILTILLVASALAAVLASCASAPEPTPEAEEAEMQEPLVRRPDILDHKNYKWGQDVPEWVMMDALDIEQMEEYEDHYVFKFESPRAANLQGAELWTRNFTASSQIAQIVQNRVQTKFAGAAAGDMDMLETYMEQVVQSFSEAQFSGYTPEADYWVQMRYYDAEGEPTEEAYTYVVLYTIERDTLDQMIQDALERAGEEPDTEEEETARDRVREAMSGGL
jgi:hypothetical protein